MTFTRLLARPMLASMFLVGGVNALKNSKGHAEAARPVADKVVPPVQQAGVPVPQNTETLVRINAGVQIVGALALATGKAPRLGALALAGTLVPTTAAHHRFWEETDPDTKANQKIHFFKNVSMLGGLLVAAVDTDGKPGLAWRARRAAKDARREAGHLGTSARREAKLARAKVG